ncbi:acyltransferase family protein [Chitinilyticum piscinae]|uniref:Acyltransferase n=1 Tax=Chitinilyticum piscinae TaxID=2866724 RepID=A0A8J7FJS1_9NEIS|nr:acyltransferase [Chitinilyticum piscinae]MBE9609167.1 acyltransferase [Chitinilyticum piscinae]
MSAATSQRFVVLDSFRGIAALCVVVFHLHLLQGFSQWEFFRSAGLWVEFFFVLSGFVLCHSYGQRDWHGAQLRDYLISRSCRIFPLHIAMLLVLTLGQLLLWLAGKPAFLGSMAASEWLPNLLLLQAWLPESNPFSFNGPAWSISVEFYLYLGLAAVLLLTPRPWRSVAYATISAVCVLCVVTGQPFSGSGTFRGVTCFAIGALAYCLYRRLARTARPLRFASLLELAALLALYVVLTAHYPAKSLLASLFFAAFILLFARENGAISRQLRRPVFEQLGHWSFGIYLTHVVLLHAIDLLLRSMPALGGPNWLALVTENGNLLVFVATGSATGDSLFGLGVLLLVIAAAATCYRLIEQPGMALGKRWRQSRWATGESPLVAARQGT